MDNYYITNNGYSPYTWTSINGTGTGAITVEYIINGSSSSTISYIQPQTFANSATSYLIYNNQVMIGTASFEVPVPTASPVIVECPPIGSFYVPVRRMRERTAAEEIASSERQRLIAEEQEQRRLALTQANDRAKGLLSNLLRPAQRAQLERENRFELTIEDRIYRISHGSRVERLDPVTKRPTSLFCIHPSTEHRVPAHDIMLSQKLLLETDEKDFLRIANETRVA